MIIDVTFAYKATVLAPRQRNARARTYLATVPVEVREATPDEAPVAIRVSDPDEPGKDRELLWDGTSLYEAAMVPDWERGKGNPPEARASAWLLSAAVDGWRGSSSHDDPFSAQVRGHDEVFEGPVEGDARVARITETGIDERMAEVRAAAARWLVVDGVVHAVAEEPVYSISSGGLLDRRRDRYMSVGTAPKWEDAGNMTFRADERELMLSLHQVSEHCVTRVIEVLVPEAVRAPLAEGVLAAEARSVLKQLGKHVLAGDVDMFRDYAALRDDLAAYEAGMAAVGHDAAAPGAPGPDDLVGTLQVAMGRLRQVSPDDGYYVRNAQRALDRIDARAMGQDLVPSP